MGSTSLLCLLAARPIFQKVRCTLALFCVVQRLTLSTVTVYPRHNYNSGVQATGTLSLNALSNQTNRDSHAMDPFRSHNSPRMRDKAYTKSEAGFRDQFAFMKSNQAIPSAYRPFPGLIPMLQRSRTGDGFVNGERSPMPCGEDDASDDSFTSSPRHDEHGRMHSRILVPSICVTPDTRVVHSGYHNFWVAVEVTAELHRPDHDNKSAFEGTTTSQNSSGSAQIGKKGHIHERQAHADATQVP